MIKFFRKIRQQSLTENKFSKYLLYAIGEVILVVIGILIALQINNWNNDLENKKIEQNIIQNLNLEFKLNKESLQVAIDFHKPRLNCARDLMKLMGEPKHVLNKLNLDSLIALSIDYKEYVPSKVVYTDLISSGRLNIISSDLRLLLFDWSIALEGIKEAFKTADEISQTLIIPYLIKNASMKNIDSYTFIEWKEKSKLSTNYYKMFQDLEFENIIENQIWDITNYIMTLENLKKSTDKVINKTNKQLRLN